MSIIKPYIATPCYGGVKSRYAGSIADTMYWLGKNNIPFEYPDPIHNFDVPTARNVIVSMFLASDCDPLVFIDSDMGWTAKAFFRLLSASQIHDVCCGTYPKKSDPLKPKEWTHSMPQTGQVMWQDGRELIAPNIHPVTHFIELAAAGTGFMAIRRRALQQIIAALPEQERDVELPGAPDDRGAWIFTVKPIPRDGMRDCVATEDHVFCRIYREQCGGQIWCDPHSVLEHVGDYIWSGCLLDTACPVDRQEVAA